MKEKIAELGLTAHRLSKTPMLCRVLDPPERTPLRHAPNDMRLFTAVWQQSIQASGHMTENSNPKSNPVFLAVVQLATESRDSRRESLTV